MLGLSLLRNRESSIFLPTKAPFASCGFYGPRYNAFMALSDRSPASRSVVRYRAGGFFRRLLATVVDVVVLAPLLVLLLLALVFWFSPASSHQARPTIEWFLTLLGQGGLVGRGWLIVTGVTWFWYRFVFHAGWGCTLGQRLLGLRLIDEYGERPGLARTGLRALAAIGSLGLAGGGFLWAAFDKQRRTLHDWIAGTYVIRNSSLTSTPRIKK